MQLCSWLSPEILMRTCFGGDLMTEEILLCPLRVTFSIAWAVTGWHLDRCPVFAQGLHFRAGAVLHMMGASLEGRLSRHYDMVGTDSCLSFQ